MVYSTKFFFHKKFCRHFSFPVCANFPAHSIVVDFIHRKILCEESRLRSSSRCNFLQFPFAFRIVGPNIILSTLLQNILRPWFSRDVKKSLKGRLVGLFSALQPKADCTLTANEFLYSSPEAPRTLQARETSASEGRNYYQGI